MVRILRGRAPYAHEVNADDPISSEAARLQALKGYQILDTLPEAAYDRFVRLARMYFKVPIALVSLVDDDRQWFKACDGLSLTETPRSMSFCAHALTGTGVLVIPDTHADPRFIDNALVTGDPHLRFYACAPLVTLDGHGLGTLCILDVVPRDALSADECELLQHLADSVMSELELRRTVARLAHQEAVYASVLDASLDAIIVMDGQGSITEWNPAAETLFGYHRTEVIGQELSQCIIPPELRQAHQRGLARYLQSGEGTVLGRRLELPALRRDGQIFVCEIAITALDLPGERLFTAAVRDLTDMKAAQDALESSHRLLRAVIDSVPEAIFVKDHARRYTMINLAGAAQIGRPEADILGRTDEDLFPEAAASAARHRDEHVLTQAQAASYEVTDRMPSGAQRTFWSSKMPAWGPDGALMGLIGVAIDITERKVAETTTQHHNSLLRTRVEAAQLEVLERLARAAEYRDDDTGEHMMRVGDTAAGIAAELGLEEADIHLLRQAAPLHDVGKIGIPDSVLLKPGRLTPEEFDLVKTHCVIGSNILAGGQSPLVVMAEEIARTHHERWDGSGYPSGLSGPQIPLSGRVVAVADVFDALTNERPYKEAWSQEAALDEIRAQAGRQFDPQVVEAFMRVMARRASEAADEDAHVPDLPVALTGVEAPAV